MKHGVISFSAAVLMTLLSAPLTAWADANPDFDDDAKPILRAQPGLLDANLDRQAVAFDGRLDGIQQVLVAERLGQKLARSVLHRAHAHGNVAMTRDEDDGNGVAEYSQFALEIQPAQAGQPHVEH